MGDKLHYKKPNYFEDAMTFVIWYLSLVPVSLFLIGGAIFGMKGGLFGICISLMIMFPVYMGYTAHRRYKWEKAQIAIWEQVQAENDAREDTWQPLDANGRAPGEQGYIQEGINNERS